MALETITLSINKVAKQGGVVVLPLEEYERLREDLDMAQAKKLPKEITRARQEAREGKVISLVEARKRLRL